ncbi:P-loop containing nucleoside triphosphate hydrolase protein [Nemania abortiva]|nr:P-loop containing nucleoside triphosphate hydrolase protein [Nemania abortiva]
MPSLPHPRWLLLSDIHFRLRDFDRTRRTAEWIVSLVRETPAISRVVVCGDVLTSRSMQPTAVLSAAYRFLSDLSRSVPHINVILGNHDLAYRRDYRTTALEALSMPRLQPFVTLHDEVARYNWDGRDVLVLPFREDQTELTAAVANLSLDHAARAVAFAHLAINRAVTQRHVVRSDSGDMGYSTRYQGLTGPDHFSALARTFTGHFHSHQTIIRSNQDTSPAGCEDCLKGSLTYLGAPLQLTWADLYDEDRGVVLFNPATLEHKLIVNPHAVGYMTVQGSEVLNDNIDAPAVQGKHVMILGKSTQFQYWLARDKLLSLGARSVREPRPTPTRQDRLVLYHGLGASVPESDRGVALISAEPSDFPAETSRPTLDEHNASLEPDDLQPVEMNLVEYVGNYVRSSAAESMHEEKTIQLGQRLLLASDSLGDDAEYKVLLDPTIPIATPGDSLVSTRQVFVAKPRSIVISNFLGIQEECTIDFDRDLGRGLTFVVGNNGSGKSTLIEAIVWCQFGRCIRKGFSVGDVINDIAGRDCRVSLSFSNGYTITRYRKHKIHGNRVIVSLNGTDQPRFEHGEARASQAALDELLGIDYEEFIKTVVLGHESATSFLSSTPTQRHDLIDSALGLSALDQSADLSRRMLREIDKDIATLHGRINTVKQTMSLIQDRIANRKKDLRRLRREEEKARKAIDTAGMGFLQNQASDHDVKNRRAHHALEDLNKSNERLEELKSKIKESQKAVDQAQSAVKKVEIWEDVTAQLLVSDQDIHTARNQYRTLQDELERSEQAQCDLVTTDTHTFESTLRSLAQTISWLQQHLLKVTDFFRPRDLVTKITLDIIRVGLRSLGQLSSHLNDILDQYQSLIRRQKQEVDATKSAIGKTRAKLAEKESGILRLTKKREEIYSVVALNRGLDEQYVRSLSNTLTKTNAQNAKRQLSTSLNHLSQLLEEQGVLHDLRARHQRESVRRSEEARSQAILQETLAKKEQEIATYQKLIEEEFSWLDKKRSSHAAIEAEIESLMQTRELFAFWETSFSRRGTKSATTSTFRGYILDKGLQELNDIASKILLVLYENTYHVRELTKGMLRTMIAADECDSDPGGPHSAALLDQTLSVTKTLSYAKRSGGERKRIDLAVFFALVQILQARSTHRARYILVDEAFDSLDAAGQAAVVRWCLQLTTRTDFQLVVTHSDYLASSTWDASNDGNGDGAESRSTVLSATMTEEGSKFSCSRA